MDTLIRHAVGDDIPRLRTLIKASVRGLQPNDYTSAQIECALTTVYGVDTQLLVDGTYFLCETSDRSTIAGCGGWSKRKTLHGGDGANERDDSLLDPQVDAAKIRAFFVHPDWTRRGIASAILTTCEGAARAAGFNRFELSATLTGVRFYTARGYAAVADVEVPLASNLALPTVRMEKRSSP